VSIWRHIADEQSGYLFNLSDSMRIIEELNPGFLNELSHGQLVVASDYSGQHKNAQYEAYGFLVTTDHYLLDWVPSFSDFRSRYLPDGRRIAFKNANEKMRRAALPEFLNAVGCLRSNIVTILVDRNVGSFSGGNLADLRAALPDCFPERAPDVTVEKMLRLASFVALVLAGLRQELQPSFWISDHDETLDSFERREHFARLSTYLTFGLTKWTAAADHIFGTTGMNEQPYWSEDLVAVPDLVAGAYCKLAPSIPSGPGPRKWVCGMYAAGNSGIDQAL